MDPDIENFMKKCAEERAAQIPALLEAKWKFINGMLVGEKFPAGMGETVRPPSEAAALDAARIECRRVAMVLHAEARAVLQNLFLCPNDVKDALDHLCTARHAVTLALESPQIINILDLPKQ